MLAQQYESASVNRMSSTEDVNKKKLVLCVGCCVMDFVTITPSFPKEDSDERCLKGYWQRGGNASNNCSVLRQLDCEVEFFGMLSNAEAFRILLDDMRQRSIKFDNCAYTNADSPFSNIILSQDTGTRTIVHCNMNFPYVTLKDFQCLQLENYGWIHFEARFSKVTSEMMQVIHTYNAERQEKIIISVDLEKHLDENLILASYCDYLIVAKDVAIEQGWNTSAQACKGIRQLLQRKYKNCPLPCIIVPWSSKGAGCLDKQNNYKELPAYTPNKVVDTLGAGDTFMAAFIYAIYIRNQQLAQAVDFANHTAGHKIAHCGYDKVAEVLQDVHF